MSTLGVSIQWEETMSTLGGYHDECGGTFPTFIMISPSVLMISPSALNNPQCVHDIPNSTHDIPQCTEHPLLYCTPPVYCTDIMQGDHM